MTGGGLTSALANVPHFVYRLYDQDGALLYVGATSSIGSRLTQHGSKDWWSEVRGIEVEHYASPIDALLADEAGLTYEQIRGLREHYTGPVTRWNRHNLPRYAPLAEQITSLADAERVAAKHPA